jgi:hypothetical protein
MQKLKTVLVETKTIQSIRFGFISFGDASSIPVSSCPDAKPGDIVDIFHNGETIIDPVIAVLINKDAH